VNPSKANSQEKALALDPRTYARGLACVHCGLCLPACPTYTQTGHEADSPRGRIQLMLGLADGRIEATASVRKHLDLCLDCRGCETACPSSVVYHELIEETRARMAVPRAETSTAADRATTEASPVRRPLEEKLLRLLFFHVFTKPTRLKLALLPARVMQKSGLYGLMKRIGVMKLLPPGLRKMEQMLPPSGPLWPRALPELNRSTGVPPVSSSASTAEAHGRNARATMRVGFFPGCVGSALFHRVNRQAVELLAACGADVFVPRTQGCCGAIHHHNGAHAPAEALARANIAAFEACDVVTTTIAGCGAMLREYDFLLRDDPEWAERAKAFAAKVRDVSEVLTDLALPPMTHAVNEVVTYHDACHLAHAQRVTAQPRALLAKIPGLRLVPLPESDICCGAAGTYNLTQPEMATDLAERKLRNIETTGAPICATGNVGCAMHISSEAAARGQVLRVVHPVELLHRAVFGSENVVRKT
jgi:glycolate oxidase iron-sulfur subunit